MRFRTVSVAVLALLVALAASLPAAAYPRPGRTELASRSLEGGTPGGVSTGGAISDDGRYVLFISSAQDLVEGKTNRTTDLYVYDRDTGETARLSRAYDGGEPNSSSFAGGLSADGRYAVFTSPATNLVPDDTNSTTDTFVFDRSTGETERVSVAADGTQANAASQNAAISADGRYVAFASRATNLTDPPGSGQLHAYVKDRVEGNVYLASQSSDGVQGNVQSFYPTLSGDGRYVVFYTGSNNLGASDTNGRHDIYLHDIVRRTTEKVSVTWNGGQANDSSVRPTISRDGNLVAFSSHATNMAPNGATGQMFPYDVYVRDRARRRTERISTSAAGVLGDSASYVPDISADGRYVTFTSIAGNLVRGDTNQTRDAYVFDRELLRMERVSVGPGEVQGNESSSHSSITPDGSFATFFSQATNFVVGDDNDSPDVFVRERGRDLDVLDVDIHHTSATEARVLGAAIFTGALLSQAIVPGQMLIENSGIEIAGADVIQHVEEQDVLFRWRLNGLNTLPISRSPVPLQYVGVTFNTPTGRYEIRIQEQLEGQGVNVFRPFATRTELYRCAGECVHIADLPGSLGTTGSEARALLPMETLGLAPGDPLTAIRVYTAVGPRRAGQDTRIQGLNLPDAEVAAPVLRLGVTGPDASQDQVIFERVALEDGRFDVTLATPEGSYRLWTRVCLAQACEVGWIDVTREPDPGEGDPDEGDPDGGEEDPVLEPAPAAMTMTLEQLGNEVIASARLTDADSGVALPDRELVFFLNGNEIGTTLTDGTGTGSQSIARQDLSNGDVITAVFAGDEDYLAAEASHEYRPGRTR